MKLSFSLCAGAHVFPHVCIRTYVNHDHLFFFFFERQLQQTQPAQSTPIQEWRPPVTHQGDTDGILILFGEDAHHGRAQQQQDQGVPELKGEQQNLNITKANAGSSLWLLGSSDLPVRPG